MALRTALPDEPIEQFPDTVEEDELEEISQFPSSQSQGRLHQKRKASEATMAGLRPRIGKKRTAGFASLREEASDEIADSGAESDADHILFLPSDGESPAYAPTSPACAQRSPAASSESSTVCVPLILAALRVPLAVPWLTVYRQLQILKISIDSL